MLPLNFSWYGFLVGLAIITGFLVTEHILLTELEGKKRQLANWHWITAVTLIVGCGILGARLYHVWTDWSLYANQPFWTWFAVWQGGLGIYGGVLGGLIGGVLWHTISKPPISLLFLLDSIALALPFGQAIGRWGNWVNQELFGLPTNAPWGIFIDPAHRPLQFLNETHFHPLFLYESLSLLFFGVGALWIWKLSHTLPKNLPFLKVGTGFFLAFYFFIYGSVRFLLDFLRWDLQTTWLQLSYSQWFSAAAIGVSLILFGQMARKLSRNSLLIIPLLVLFLSIPQPIQAQQSAEFDLSIQPSVVEIAVQPGKLVTQAFELSNAGTVDLEVTLTLRDFKADGLTGQPVLLETNTFPYASLQNADIALEKPFVLNANSSQQVVLGMDLPLNAEKKDSYFVLLAKTRPLTSWNITGSGAGTSGNVAANVLVRVSQDNLDPLSWKLDVLGVPRFLDSLQSFTLSPLVTNTGRTFAAPELKVTITNWRGQLVYEQDGLPDRILAQSSRRIAAAKTRKDDPRSLEPTEFTFDPLFAFGPYTVTTTIKNAASEPVVVEQQFLALPFTLALAVIALSLALTWTHKQRKKRKQRQE